MKTERDETARNLALVEKELSKTKQELALAEKDLSKTKEDLIAMRIKADDLDKTLVGLNSKLTTSDAELIKKRGELENLEQATRTGQEARHRSRCVGPHREDARVDVVSKLKASEKKLDEVTRSVGDQSKMQAKIDALEKDIKAERTKLDEANVTIIDLQGTKAKLADKVNKLQIETENKFAGIAMTGKNVVFLVDMSGSMDRTDENTLGSRQMADGPRHRLQSDAVASRSGEVPGDPVLRQSALPAGVGRLDHIREGEEHRSRTQGDHGGEAGRRHESICRS